MLEPWAETGFFWSSESDRRGVMLLVRMVASSFRCVDRAFQHSELAEFVRGPPRLLSSPFGLVTAFVWKVVQRGVNQDEDGPEGVPAEGRAGIDRPRVSPKDCRFARHACRSSGAEVVFVRRREQGEDGRGCGSPDRADRGGVLRRWRGHG